MGMKLVVQMFGHKPKSWTMSVPKVMAIHLIAVEKCPNVTLVLAL